MYMYMYRHKYTYIHIHIPRHKHPQKHMHMHFHMHKRILMHMHKHVHIQYIYIYTPSIIHDLAHFPGIPNDAWLHLPILMLCGFHPKMLKSHQIYQHRLSSNRIYAGQRKKPCQRFLALVISRTLC